MRVFALKDGAVWNPIFKLPRNILCPCRRKIEGKRRKLKNCCLVNAPRAVSKKIADQITKAIEKDLALSLQERLHGKKTQ